MYINIEKGINFFLDFRFMNITIVLGVINPLKEKKLIFLLTKSTITRTRK